MKNDQRTSQMFFTTEKIEHHLKDIHASMSQEVYDIPRFKFIEGEAALDCEGHLPDLDDSSWENFTVGDSWGGYDVTAWFRTRVPILEHLQGEKLFLRFLVGPRDGGGSTAESLLYVNGQPLQGIDVWHEDAWLPPEHLQLGYLDIALKAWSGVLEVPKRRRFVQAQLVRVNQQAERYYFLASTLYKTLKLLDENDLRRVRLLGLLDQSLKCVDFSQPHSVTFNSSLEAATMNLLEGLTRLERSEIKPKITALGHSHIDLAWLWRLQHTREKASRTFSTVLHLMRQYPEYQYLHSSPQLYKLLKEDYPAIFARVKEKILSGDWEVAGGMWVEADTNLTGGESIVRQILLGKRYVRKEFGVDMKTLWLPDAFGFSAALPQIIKKSGMDYFITSKISWSQYNRFPYDTFHWTGIDGSQVLSHFITTPDASSPSYTYNGTLEPSEVKGIWDNYQQKDLNDELLLLYGWGDGGGGPTMEMLESARIMENIPGLPEVRLGRAEDFMERLDQRVKQINLPVWDGELYLEYHRGTYTSQADIKRANRKAEILFHDAEWLCSMADIINGTGNYPAEDLREAWESILLNQFHDILPGSSIRQVYEDSRVAYENIQKAGEKALKNAQKAILAEIPVPSDSLVVFNPLAWGRDALVELSFAHWTAGTGMEALPVQVIESGAERRILVAVHDVPAMGYQTFPLLRSTQRLEAGAGLVASQSEEKEWLAGGRNRSKGRIPADQIVTRSISHSGLGVVDPRSMGFTSTPWKKLNGEVAVHQGQGGVQKDPRMDITAPSEAEIIVQPDWIENRYYQIRLNSAGQITSIWDKSVGREVLPEGARANVFQAFEDKPMNFDAWDIDLYYQEKMVEVNQLEEAFVEETGPLRGSLRLCWNFRNSTLTQRIHVYQYSRRIDFLTEVDWHEHQTLLKTSFPVNIRSTRATYDIQFGCIERPTHWNTSWDYARFESVAHKWVDLSEGNYGVSLLNDCKYGHDVKGNTLRMTLIKSALHPDPSADQGRHQFSYALFPHAGDWRSGGVARQAYELNYPVMAEVLEGPQQGRLPGSFSFIAVDVENVVIESIKKAEEGDAWIVRLYENAQSRLSTVRVAFGSPITRAVECNLIEEEDRPVEYDRNSVIFSILPFEIKTFKVWFGS